MFPKRIFITVFYIYISFDVVREKSPAAWCFISDHSTCVRRAVIVIGMYVAINRGKSHIY